MSEAISGTSLAVVPHIAALMAGYWLAEFGRYQRVGREAVPAACKDAAGVDRAAIHRRIEAEVADFLRNNL